MDSKKVIEKLLKIATNQQKIIMKLAQNQPPAAAPAPASIAPHDTTKQTARAIINALPPAVQQAIVNIEERGNDMIVGFKPGQNTDANFKAVLNTMQKLTDTNVLPRAYTLKVAG